MGKMRIIAKARGRTTWGGDNGSGAGFECVVYMSSEDIKRQAINVYRMRFTRCRSAPSGIGSKTLKGH
ncbi:MAG: hypothetical protein R3E08_07280 [Thiotrichaceae bacterium]